MEELEDSSWAAMWETTAEGEMVKEKIDSWKAGKTEDI